MTTNDTATAEALARANAGANINTAELALLGQCTRATAVRRMNAAGFCPVHDYGGRRGKVWRAEDALKLYLREI